MKKISVANDIKINFLIPARKGSKGFKFKNRKLFNKTADKFPDDFELLDNVYVSTDDEEIKKMAKLKNFNIVNRNVSLASDTASIKDVVIEFIEKESVSKDEIIVLLFLTYPERTWEDVVDILNCFLSSNKKSLQCLEPVETHPYLTVLKQKDHYVSLIEHNLYRRQDYPEVFKTSMFFSCFYASEVEKLNDLMYNKNTYFYHLKEVTKDIDYEKQLK